MTRPSAIPLELYSYFQSIELHFHNSGRQELILSLRFVCSPVDPLSTEEFHLCESQITAVPISPIEDEEAPSDVLSNLMASPITLKSSLAPGVDGPSSILGVASHTPNEQILGRYGTGSSSNCFCCQHCD